MALSNSKKKRLHVANHLFGLINKLTFFDIFFWHFRYFQVEISIGEEEEKKAEISKIVPTWMTESTVVKDDIGEIMMESSFNPTESAEAHDEIHELMKSTEAPTRRRF